MDRQHAFVLPQYVIDRVMAKRGHLHVFDRLEPAGTAPLVIDMQNFCVAEVATARAIAPNIDRLAAALCSPGGAVAWVNMTAVKGGESPWPPYHGFGDVRGTDDLIGQVPEPGAAREEPRRLRHA